MNHCCQYLPAALLPAALFILTGCGDGKPKHGGWVENEPKVIVVKSTKPVQTRVNIGAPPEVIKKVIPPDENLPKLATLQVTLPAGWKKEFSANTNEWFLDRPETVTPGGDIKPLTRVRVTRSPKQIEPHSAAEYARFLLKPDEENFIWPQVMQTGMLPDGFFIIAQCRLAADVTSTNLDTGFVVVRTIKGDRIKFKCHRVVDDAIRQEALEMCKAAQF